MPVWSTVHASVCPFGLVARIVGDCDIFLEESLFPFFFFPDCRRGQSLVVHAINEGRQAARQIDLDLMGHTSLAGPGGVVHTPGSKVYRHAEHANKIYKPLLEAMAWR